MECYNSAVVNASVAEVWAVVRDFHHLDWGKPMITSVQSVSDVAGDEVGAQRILNGAFHETLRSTDDAKMEFTYSIDDGPEPVSKSSVSNYIGTVRLLPVTATNQTFVEWTSRYQSDDPGLVADFCNPIYAALLEGLTRHFAG